MKTTIDQVEYLQIVGLLTLATNNNRALKDIRASIAAIIEIDPHDRHGKIGHIDDVVYNDESVASLIRRLELQVLPHERLNEARADADRLYSSALELLTVLEDNPALSIKQVLDSDAAESLRYHLRSVPRPKE